MKSLYKNHTMKHFRRNIISCFLISLLFVSPVIISAEDISFEEYLNNEEIVYIGEIKVLPIKSPTRVAIGNPQIADITKVSEDAVSIAGKGAGSTTLVVWDELGERSFEIRVLTADMTNTKRRVDNLLKPLKLDNVYTKANHEEGRILILGDVPTEEERELIELALGELFPQTIDLLQVKDEGVIDIEVQVLELDRDATKTLGFTLPGQFSVLEASGPTANAVTGFSALFHVSDWTRNALTATVDFLEQEGKARILSRPRLTCSSGKEAELLVGGEKPMFSTAVQSGGASSTSIEYKEYGIKLNIQPTIDDGRIHVGLNVEVSEIGDAITIGDRNAPSAKAFPLTKRNISTEIYLDNGQTLAIGGIIKEKLEEDIRKNAFLGDIPIIGALFRKKETKMGGGQGERGNVELFITLTPTIVSEIKKAQAQESKEEKPVEFSQEDVQRLLNEYVQMVQTKILNAAYYPADAEELGWSGTVRLSLLISDNGSLQEVVVQESSGHAVLDEAALGVVKNEDPYPSFPYQLRADELRVEVPIAFRRNNN